MDPVTAGEPAGAGEPDFISKARAAGWVERTEFDYDAYERSDKPTEGWYGNSAVYEWKGEYGDIGPSVEALEHQLFGSKNRMREGSHRQALDLEVDIAGPTKCAPLRRVSEPHSFRALSALLFHC